MPEENQENGEVTGKDSREKAGGAEITNNNMPHETDRPAAALAVAAKASPAAADAPAPAPAPAPASVAAAGAAVVAQGSTMAPAESPVLVFLNSASDTLFDLQEVGQGKWKPEEKLKLFQYTKGTKVLICGGDGTMGWILSCIDRLRTSTAAEPPPVDPGSGSAPASARSTDGNFHVAMMPLGTGNDLSRTFGWGPGFARSMLQPKFLERVKEAPPAKLDRWLLSVMPYEPLGDDDAVKKTKIPPTFSVHRYASAIGNPISGMNEFGPIPDTSERTQKVVRMGRSFSIRMSSQAKLVHEDEMNRSSSQGSRSLQGSRHGHREGSFRGSFGGGSSFGGEFKTEETIAESEAYFTSGRGGGGTAEGGGGGGALIPQGMLRASSAPPVLRHGRGAGHVAEGAGGGSSAGKFAMPTVGEVVDGMDSTEKGEASSLGSSSSSPAPAKDGGVSARRAGEKKEEEQPQQQQQPSPSPLPSSGVEGAAAKREAHGVVAHGAGATGVARAAAAEARGGGAEKKGGEVRHRNGASGGLDGEKKEVAVQTEKTPRRTGPMPRAMPSISVIQRYETWESYDAVFCNYFSFGVDAIAAAAFHEHRQAYPQLFTSRFRNQVWYARKGFPAAGGVPCGSRPPPTPVSQYLELRVKNTPEGEWETLELDSTLRGVVVLNLQSYGGGRNLWGSAEAGCSQMQYAKAAPDDGLLEIVGITNIFKLGCIMGFNKFGARAHRLTQAAEVELRIRAEIHMQIDGEPWKQAPAKINIQHYGQSTCLQGRRS
eukprot:g10946.t1